MSTTDTNNLGLQDFLALVLRRHPAAIEFMTVLAQVAHVWDDLIDRDKPMANSAVDIAFFHALVTLPSNSFYREHFASLQPVLVNAILNWHAANGFEWQAEARPEDADARRLLEVAHIIRSDYANVLIHCAYLVGGMQWALEATPRIREWWAKEDFAQYLKNLELEREARALKEPQ